jgi:hypothetical protein
MEANVALSLVENEGIKACLSDENTVNAYSFYEFAVGGVKIMVAEEDAARAVSALNNRKQDVAIPAKDDEICCPRCKSRDVETIDTRWKAFLTILMLGVQLFSGRNRYECQSCGHSWKK